MSLQTNLTWAKVFGILIIIVYLAMSFAFQSKIGDQKVKNPIVELEFASSGDHVVQLLSDNNGGINNNLVQALALSTRIDFLFAVVYSLFLVFFFAAVKVATEKKIYLLAIVLSLVAMVFDILENTQILSILGKVEGSQSFERHISLMHIFTWVKWLSLTIALAIAAWFGIGQRRALPLIIGLIALIPLLLALPAMFYHSLTTIFALTVILGIIAIIILVFAGLKKLLT